MLGGKRKCCSPPWFASQCVLVSVLVISMVSVCLSHKSDIDVDSLIKLLFTKDVAKSDQPIEYADLASFVTTLADELVKSAKYDAKCLKRKLSKLDSLPGQQAHHADHHQHEHDKFKEVSSLLVASVNSCLISAKHSDSNSSHAHDHDHDHSHESADARTEKIEQPKHASKHYKWLAAFAAATIISVVGVFCVAVVPLLNKFCFDYLFQFLVALAIGTLTGDAMLHLIPHAFVEHHEESHDNTQHNHASVYKGLGALTGIYTFFLIEKLMKMRHQRTEEKKFKKSQKDSLKYQEAGAILEPNGASAIMMAAGHENDDDKDSSVYDNFASPALNKTTTNEESEVAIPSSKNHKVSSHKHNHGHAHHSHHGHGHLHSHQNGIKTNAWMVIMGDGLHNFSDGLAIGASFANSITAGIGTTVAIFFHELPHEIGDFALLRKSGVTLKRAILFNILSSVLCFLGILLGLLIGSISFVSNWSFLFIAGVFLYISLVDMLPELSTNGERCSEFILQNFGFIAGVGIMLLIALYEHKLTKLLEL